MPYKSKSVALLYCLRQMMYHVNTSLCLLLIFFFTHLSFFSFGQTPNASPDAYQIEARFLSEKVRIDGKLEEQYWQTAPKAKDFFQNFPFDSSFALRKTEVMLGYDEQNLYIAAICIEPNDDKKIAQSLRRDFNPGVNDCFVVYLDPFGDQTNGFSFGVSTLGVQREGLLVNGGDLATDWDNKWYAEAAQTSGGYVVEMAIPFKTLRFKPNAKQWRINFARVDRQINEVSVWKPIPRNFAPTSLAFTGTLVWDNALPKTGANVTVIPYLAGQNGTNYLGSEPTKNNVSFGADVKLGVTSSLNLDLTFNPDFSQVEVDRQVTNLDRFEIFFPERRQFFLENQDIFSRTGFSRIRPFFSRRIGISRDTTTGDIVQNPILYGVRLSGKVNKDWRIGLLNMQTAQDKLRGINGQNYTVATFQKQVFARSNFAGILVNRTRTSDAQRGFSLQTNDFMRVVGLDYNLASQNNKWSGKFFYHQLLTPINQKDQYSHASYLQYATPKLRVSWNHEFVGKNYTPDLGFVPRTDHWRLEPSMNYRFYPKKSKLGINNHGPNTYHNLFWTSNGILTDRKTEIGYNIDFNNSASFGIWISNNYVLLRNSFNPSTSSLTPDTLATGTGYYNNSFAIYYRSNERKRFYYSSSLSGGEFYNGNIITLDGEISYRLPPFGAIGLSYNLNWINLPKPWGNSSVMLLSPRIDLTLTRSVFFTLFTQYNRQTDNINLNARLQWRFKPVSDLFLVYTDNYFAESLKIKNRAIVLKMTYWLNI